MSTKDTRYYRKCVICGDKLIGTDDGEEVFESLEEQLKQGIKTPNCTLCGEPVTPEMAMKIFQNGPPPLLDNDD